jgi:hypothetical protein
MGKVVPLLTMQAYSRNVSTAPFVSKDCSAFIFTVKQCRKNSEDDGATSLRNTRNYFLNGTA